MGVGRTVPNLSESQPFCDVETDQADRAPSTGCQGRHRMATNLPIGTPVSWIGWLNGPSTRSARLLMREFQPGQGGESVVRESEQVGQRGRRQLFLHGGSRSTEHELVSS